MNASGGWHSFAERAMGSPFEVRIAGMEWDDARHAARAAFEVLHRLEDELSRYHPTSAVSQIARLPEGGRLRIGAAAYECLELALEVWADTGGALDVTIAPILDFWRRVGPDATVDDTTLAGLYERVGSELISLDRATHSVQVHAERIEIDLGAIGKGYGVDQMVERLREWGVASALVHGGASSMYALGAPPGWEGFPIALRHPEEGRPALAELALRDVACSGSGALLADPEGAPGLHIVDPRSGRLCRQPPASWALAPTAARSAALSTAFMLLTVEQIESYCRLHPEISALCVDNEPGGLTVHKMGSYFAGKD